MDLCIIVLLLIIMDFPKGRRWVTEAPLRGSPAKVLLLGPADAIDIPDPRGLVRVHDRAYFRSHCLPAS